MRELPGDAIRASRTAARPTHHRRGLVVATVAALVMTFTGAFGTDAIPLLPRLGYWLVIMEAGALIGIGAATAVQVWGGLASNRWAEGAGISLLIAFPLTLVVVGTTALFFGSRFDNWARIAVMFVMVLGVTAVITAVNYATSPPVDADPAPAAVPLMEDAPTSISEATPSAPRLAERLPPHMRQAPIVAVQAEDHYLRIHTTAGSELILMRLGDAIAELAPIEGARTHRSWWIARGAVESVTRKDGRAELGLTGGIVAPVSRSAYPELRQAGWFD